MRAATSSGRPNFVERDEVSPPAHERVSVCTRAHDRALISAFARALEPAVAAGMVEINASASYVGLPNFLRYNEPEGPNSVKKAWPAALELLPECDEKARLIGRCRSYLLSKAADFRRAVGVAALD